MWKRLTRWCWFNRRHQLYRRRDWNKASCGTGLHAIGTRLYSKPLVTRWSWWRRTWDRTNIRTVRLHLAQRWWINGDQYRQWYKCDWISVEPKAETFKRWIHSRTVIHRISFHRLNANFVLEHNICHGLCEKYAPGNQHHHRWDCHIAAWNRGHC
jgi:hypothetical protein